jgi:hypothetical protein
VTAQVHEKLVLDGQPLTMAFCPPIPVDHPRIVELDRAQASRDAPPVINSTACWRGYIGSWEIKDGLFYLAGLQGRLRLTGIGPLLADWFSGILRVPQGKILHYVHMGFGSIYEYEEHIKIETGRVVARRRIDNRKKRFDQDDLTWRSLPGSENRFEGDDDF